MCIVCFDVTCLALTTNNNGVYHVCVLHLYNYNGRLMPEILHRIRIMLDIMIYNIIIENALDPQITCASFSSTQFPHYALTLPVSPSPGPFRVQIRQCHNIIIATEGNVRV